MRIVRDRFVSGVGSQVYGPPEASKTSWWQDTGKGSMWQMLAGYGMQGYQAREQRKHTETLARMRAEVQKAALAKGAGWIPGEYNPYNVASTSTQKTTATETLNMFAAVKQLYPIMLIGGGVVVAGLVVGSVARARRRPSVTSSE